MSVSKESRITNETTESKKENLLTITPPRSTQENDHESTSETTFVQKNVDCSDKLVTYENEMSSHLVREKKMYASGGVKERNDGTNFFDSTMEVTTLHMPRMCTQNKNDGKHEIVMANYLRCN